MIVQLAAGGGKYLRAASLSFALTESFPFGATIAGIRKHC